ncbi:MAG: hypothetical protein ACI9EW_003767, partial [Cellvibrionaceae bacterium]
AEVEEAVSEESPAAEVEEAVSEESPAAEVEEVVSAESPAAEVEEPVAQVAPIEEITLTGAFRLLVAAITKAQAEEKSLKLRSIKTTMIALNSAFDEKNFMNDREKPFKSFIEFVRAAARDGIVELSGKGSTTEVSIVE